VKTGGEFLVFSFEFLVPDWPFLALLTVLVVLVQRLIALKLFSKIVEYSLWEGNGF
jgi:beta-lactamase regulating signal transducer with metallopeptidase domain